ncbi:MAG: ABC transporter ATP-binding protein [Chloroflexi bacterium]|nr:ABC transporter ATP-binding protein [Chloroflexota bacterium]NOG63819.1 ABC transporter ATP-binding protein [Chloroflexota bacterium]
MGTVTVTALQDVSLQVNKGEFVVILGPSGSGKTTLLNMLSALDRPTIGKISINGQDITSASRTDHFKFRRETIGFIFQSFNLFPSLTALENVQFAVDMRGNGNHRNGSRAAIAQEVLTQVGLGERVRHFPHELSGGEQQRVAIARALAMGNPILLADEPTGELDFRTGIQILQLLQEQALNGKTVLVVTHNREISRVADRVVELSSGQIVRDGPPQGGKAAISDLHW